MGEGFFCVAFLLFLNVPGNSGQSRKHFNNSTKKLEPIFGQNAS